MSGAVLPLPQYAAMVWCSVKAQGKLYLCIITIIIIIIIIILSSRRVHALTACECFNGHVLVMAL
jgi:hypothetical protein